MLLLIVLPTLRFGLERALGSWCHSQYFCVFPSTGGQRTGHMITLASFECFC
jgi:hypothetical protein